MPGNLDFPARCGSRLVRGCSSTIPLMLHQFPLVLPSSLPTGTIQSMLHQFPLVLPSFLPTGTIQLMLHQFPLVLPSFLPSFPWSNLTTWTFLRNINVDPGLHRRSMLLNLNMMLSHFP